MIAFTDFIQKQTFFVKKILKIVCTLLVCLFVSVVFAVLALIGSCEMMSEAEDVSFIERYNILSDMPEQIGSSKKLSSDVTAIRLDLGLEECSWGLEDMGGASVKYSLADKTGEYHLYPTFDNLPRAICWTLLHPDSYESFLDIYENDRDNAWLIKRASVAGIEGIKNSLPNI